MLLFPNDPEIVWKEVRKARHSYLTKYTGSSHCHEDYPALLNYDEIKSNVKNVINDEQNPFVSFFPLENVTKEELETAAAMFLYLNYCPPRLFLFYKELFKTSSVKDIILSFTSILRKSRNAAKNSSYRIWSIVREYLHPLFSQYEEICLKNKGSKLLKEKYNCSLFGDTLGR